MKLHPGKHQTKKPGETIHRWLNVS